MFSGFGAGAIDTAVVSVERRVVKRVSTQREVVMETKRRVEEEYQKAHRCVPRTVERFASGCEREIMTRERRIETEKETTSLLSAHTADNPSLPSTHDITCALA